MQRLFVKEPITLLTCLDFSWNPMPLSFWSPLITFSDVSLTCFQHHSRRKVDSKLLYLFIFQPLDHCGNCKSGFLSFSHGKDCEKWYWIRIHSSQVDSKKDWLIEISFDLAKIAQTFYPFRYAPSVWCINENAFFPRKQVPLTLVWYFIFHGTTSTFPIYLVTSLYFSSSISIGFWLGHGRDSLT